MANQKKWLAHHEKFLRENYLEMSNKDIVEHFRQSGFIVTEMAIRKKKQKMGIGGQTLGRKKGSKDSYKRVRGGITPHTPQRDNLQDNVPLRYE